MIYYIFYSSLIYISLALRMQHQDNSQIIQINIPDKSNFSFSKITLKIDSNKYYRLSTKWQGTNKCLDINELNNRTFLILNQASKSSSQLWKLSITNSSYIRITNKALGQNLSIDVINDGTNNKLWMAPTGVYSGQFWIFTLQDHQNFFFRLTTAWQGLQKSLDIVNDGKNNNQLILAKTGNFSGQLWKILDQKGIDIQVKQQSQAPKIFLNDMIKEEMYGFKILINKYYAKNQDVKLAKQRLSLQLKQITEILQPKRIQKLRTVPITIQIVYLPNKIAHFHPNKQWLIDNGYSGQFVNTVEICNAKRYYEDLKGYEINTMLHELSHGYRFIYLQNKLDKITQGYNNAKMSGKYDSVSYVAGGKKQHYAMQNPQEFFAEMSETYFYKNDFYPWNKTELKKYDPQTFKLMQQVLKL